jgi:hypothetical protein
VEDAEINAASQAVSEATWALEQGAVIRNTMAQIDKSKRDRSREAALKKETEQLREAARGTDHVLSKAIKCSSLRIESDGKAARLVTDTGRGKGIPYGELSHGEKWRLAIDLGADFVGEGGLLVVSQEGWESVDAITRPLIHDHAAERGVYVLTAECTRDPEEELGIHSEAFSASQEV